MSLGTFCTLITGAICLLPRQSACFRPPPPHPRHPPQHRYAAQTQIQSIRQNHQYFTLPGLFHMEWMEWGVDSRSGWWIPWNGGWIPYFWLMDSILLVDGFHTFAWWIPYFCLMDSILFHMESIIFPYGIHTFSTWNPYFSTWIPYVWSWIPYGMIWNDFMES